MVQYNDVRIWMLSDVLVFLYIIIYCLFVTELEITGFTSIPDGYGIRNDQMTFSCQFSPALDTQNIVTEWYHDGELVTTTGANENYIISSFQSSHSGNYSCSVLVMVGNVVLGGARSVEKSVKLAGKLIHVI